MMGNKFWSMLKRCIVLMGAVVAYTSDCHARDWPDAGGWEISELETGCAMSVNFEGEGETYLALLIETTGQNMVMIANENWTTKEDQNYKLDYYIDTTKYAGADSIGLTMMHKHGFGSKFSPSFADDFAKGSNFKIFRGDTLVDSLSLKGSGEGVVMLKRCAASLAIRQDIEANEKARLSHIPKNPFETPTENEPSSTSNKEGVSVPRGNSSSWVTTDDYPPSSIRLGEEGTVVVDYLVNQYGRIEDCKIKSSSGSSTLDDTTCRLVMRRGRYTPSSTGPTRMSSRHTWRLPVE